MLYQKTSHGINDYKVGRINPSYFLFHLSYNNSITIELKGSFRMRRKFKIFVSIGDIHIGMKNISAEDMKNQLEKHFIRKIETIPYLDGIFIVGDLFHTIISMNSSYSELAFWFVNKIYKIAKKKKSTIIIVKGTISHDNNQLNNLCHYMYNDDNVPFYICTEPDILTIWGDYRVLVLPDVKVKKQKDIFSYLKHDTYDLILGHGLIDSMNFFVQESEEYAMRSVVYNSADLMKHSNGPVIFGHIHQFQHIKRKFFYTGSFTLLERGVSNPGYLIGGILDDNRQKFLVERYINSDAPSYHEWKIDQELLSSCEIGELFAALDRLLEGIRENDIVTLKISRGDTMSEADKVIMLDTRYRADKRIRIIKSLVSESMDSYNEDVQKEITKFQYLFDEEIPLTDMMWKYFSEELKPNITDPSSRILSIEKKDFESMMNPQ